MAHPFEALFLKQLSRSHGDENCVLGEAERLMEEGYSPDEIYKVLLQLRHSLVSPTDEAILDEAVDAFSIYTKEQ